MKPPVLEYVDKTSFTISWLPPNSINGCPVLSYAIYRDDGTAQGLVNIPVDVSDVANKPDLFSHTVLLDGSLTGLKFNVKVEATNVMGSALSNALQFTLASAPAKPFPAPSADPSETTISQIKVNFINANTDNGGSPILAYQLDMDDGKQGDFRTILTTSIWNTYIVKNIVRGLIFRFRYRAYNVNGWSPYSETAYLFSFQAPDSPPRPEFISATDTSVTIGLGYSINDNGIPITDYELWIDAGNDSTSAFREVTGFTFAPTYTLTTAADGLGAPGTIYRLKIRAVNQDGTSSLFSSEMIFALASLPSPPSTVVKNIANSKKDTISV